MRPQKGARQPTELRNETLLEGPTSTLPRSLHPRHKRSCFTAKLPQYSSLLIANPEQLPKPTTSRLTPKQDHGRLSCLFPSGRSADPKSRSGYVPARPRQVRTRQRQEVCPGGLEGRLPTHRHFFEVRRWLGRKGGWGSCERERHPEGGDLYRVEAVRGQH